MVPVINRIDTMGILALSSANLCRHSTDRTEAFWWGTLEPHAVTSRCVLPLHEFIVLGRISGARLQSSTRVAPGTGYVSVVRCRHCNQQCVCFIARLWHTPAHESGPLRTQSGPVWRPVAPALSSQWVSGLAPLLKRHSFLVPFRSDLCFQGVFPITLVPSTF